MKNCLLCESSLAGSLAHLPSLPVGTQKLPKSRTRKGTPTVALPPLATRTALLSWTRCT